MNKMHKRLQSLIFLGFICTLLTSCGADKSGMGAASLKDLTLPTTEFAIAANADTTIFGVQGTRIFIEKGTFQFADGKPVTDSIKIGLREFYDKADMLLADLSTESDGKLLETSGMLNIAATSKGQAVEIKADKRIVVHFPKKDKWTSDSNEPMKLFYADGVAADAAVPNWVVDTTSLVKKTLKIASWGWWHPGPDDSTNYSFTPKDLDKNEYYVNPLDLYLNAYDFKPETRKEIESNLNHNDYPNFESWNDFGIECEMEITKEGYIKNPKVNSKVSSASRKDIISFLKNIPQLEPGRNKNGEIIARRGLLFIQGGQIVPLYKTREEYLKSFDKKYAGLEKNPIKSVASAELEYYIFSVAKLGWINCDRFWYANDPINFVVDAPLSGDTKIKLVFNDINGVLMADIVDGKYVFSKVPAGSEATILAINTADGNLQAAIQQVTISEQPFQDLAFEEMTLEELKKELEKLN